MLLLGSNLLFYLGLFGLLENAVRAGLYSGLYLITGLILILGGRVIPFFIERGIGRSVTLNKRPKLDIAALLVYALFWLAASIDPQSLPAALLAAALLLLHGLRLAGWWVSGIERKPMLWVLWLGYAMIVAGFGLHAASYAFGLSPFLAVHAFGYGGIGLVTLGMMSRVSLGHTGRSVYQPPRGLALIFAALLLGALIRVGGPLLAAASHQLWISLSALLWIAAFGWFCWVYLPMFLRPRVDGKPG